MAKENEVQSLHSKLTDTLVSKQQLEQRLMQLMESEQKWVNKEESLQMQVQVSVFPYFETIESQICVSKREESIPYPKSGVAVSSYNLMFEHIS